MNLNISAQVDKPVEHRTAGQPLPKRLRCFPGNNLRNIFLPRNAQKPRNDIGIAHLDDFRTEFARETPILRQNFLRIAVERAAEIDVYGYPAPLERKGALARHADEIFTALAGTHRDENSFR